MIPSKNIILATIIMTMIYTKVSTIRINGNNKIIAITNPTAITTVVIINYLTVINNIIFTFLIIDFKINVIIFIRNIANYYPYCKFTPLFLPVFCQNFTTIYYILNATVMINPTIKTRIFIII